MGSSRLFLSFCLGIQAPASVFPGDPFSSSHKQAMCITPQAFPQGNNPALRKSPASQKPSQLSSNLVCKTNCSLEQGLPCRKGLRGPLDIQEEACCYPTHLNSKKKKSPHPYPHPILLLDQLHIDCTLNTQTCKQTAQGVGHLATEIPCTLDQVGQQVEETSVICSCRIRGLGVQQRPGGDTTAC